MRQFSHEYPDIDRCWFDSSNYIGLLSVSDEDEMHKLIEKATMKDIKLSIFREPDLDNRITAIALEPGIKSRKLCSCLKLALR